MDKLKVGDIKKFKYIDNECVGVVIYTSPDEIHLCTIGGKFWRCRVYKYKLEYSATRLDPKIRESLERVAEVKKRMNKIDNDIKKLENLKEKEQGNLEKEIERLAQAQGKLTLSQLVEVFKAALKKQHPNLYNKLSTDYRIDAYDSPVGTWIHFDRYDYFDKWCNPSSYDFLTQNYDGTMYISHRSNQYKQLCEKYSSKDAKLTVGKLQGEFDNKQELQAGDKDSLCYHNCIAFNFPAECMTKNYIEKLVKSIKSN